MQGVFVTVLAVAAATASAGVTDVCRTIGAHSNGTYPINNFEFCVCDLGSVPDIWKPAPNCAIKCLDLKLGFQQYSSPVETGKAGFPKLLGGCKPDCNLSGGLERGEVKDMNTLAGCQCNWATQPIRSRKNGRWSCQTCNATSEFVYQYNNTSEAPNLSTGKPASFGTCINRA